MISWLGDLLKDVQREEPCEYSLSVLARRDVIHAIRNTIRNLQIHIDTLQHLNYVTRCVLIAVVDNERGSAVTATVIIVVV